MANAKRVIVTGAAGGAGSAAVEVFAEDGAAVAAIVHNSPLPSQARAAGDVREYTCDIADREAVNATFDRIVEDIGGLDALIHTAAIEEYVPAADLTAEHLRPMFDVNLAGTIWTNQAAYRHMKPNRRGSIVNFQSLSAIRGFAMLAHYAASKGGVGAWTRAAATEWGSDEIRINAISPVMLTSMAKNYRATLSPDELEQFMESMRQVIHLKDGEYGDPKLDIGPVLRFLVSDDSAYITGQTISVDGGWMKLGS